ncbi:MAG: tRNA guanosine(34) transglycosylase Tgt [Nitrospinaceae bacterium]|jgi:queuine tRNA-ribosyltransferase|nr:tRNA guanosine(34) transglycosylase Tgt [Nitrospinaceae bacterium]MBT4094831.1 tRNA guanosine(34) transglycosylase Tgt [Nitrospinaceae bacterium]MBT4431887.1 tRNA guanosine(34) transglycosylase Tgt [Nitrospinaceae bacterium]MBT5369267.1 tRNA guanosine(34) transglycosylase Tgt [Nitrospinaceae bacterium]MBT5948257.1 tRNA guanosine(34) transglycosylase Tgt [Nitrospinaceae bacterium]
MSGAVRIEILASKMGEKARLGRLDTPHGAVDTPAFMAVGTQATVKTLDPADLRSSGCQIILANAYHLSLRPGAELIGRLGGLHGFMGWEGPILTDSGGYQLFSLAPLAKVTDEGIDFQSHLDGTRLKLTPERVVEIQEALGPDIAMVLDEPLGFPHTRERAEDALGRTTAWAERSKAAHSRADQALFGIVQGGAFPDLRQESARQLVALDMDGYAVGGLSLGEGKSQTDELLDAATDILPADKPRYVMGMGTPADLVRGVGRGADMFDCVMPTRHARRGNLFTWEGRISIKNAANAENPDPIGEGCGCPTCQKGYSRAYLRHLFKAEEMLGYRLMTVHNLFFYQEVLSRAREAIGEGNFTSWAKEILSGPLGADPGPSGGSEGRPEASGRPLAGGKKKSE